MVTVLDKRSRAPVDGSHTVEFFPRAEFPAAAIAGRLADAIVEGRAAGALATPAHLEQLRAALDHRLDIAGAIASGQLALLDAEEVHAAMQAGSRFEVLDAMVGARVRELVARCGGARIYGELVDVLCASGDRHGAIELEQWWNAKLEALPVELHCGYAIESFDDVASLCEFHEVCDEHAHVTSSVEPAWERTRIAAELRQVSSILESETAHRAAFETAYHGSRDHVVTLQRVTSALSVAASFDEIGAVAVGAVASALGATNCGLSIGGRLIALRGIAVPDDPAAFAEALDQSHLVWAPPDDVPAALAGIAASVVCVLPLQLGPHRLGSLMLGFDRSAVRLPLRVLAGDLTHQLALAVDRARAYERAEAANVAKDQFLAMLGHELRNPLAPILTATQLMRLRSPEVLARERSMIERSVTHMTRLVDDLLDVSRIARGKVDLERAPVELGEILAGAIEVASGVLEDRAHRIHVSVPPGITIHADATRMVQVFSNLLTNSARYTRRGGAIELHTEQHGDSVVVTVSDNGVGIAANLLPVVFDLFVQGPQGAFRESGGLGIGLAIARSIVELHGGTIRAESEGIGKGSRFTVTLPLPRVDPVPVDATADGPAIEPIGRRILVVDDNHDAAWLLGEALRLLGHEVRVAYDGLAALELVRAWQPEVAFLDLGLPGMDGYALCRALVQLPHRPHVIAVTGYGQAADRDRTREAGFAAHFVKPVSLRQVEGAISALR